MLDELLERLGALPPEQLKAVQQQAFAALEQMSFVPNPGAQTEAYRSDADILLYGGAAGGGKSFLMLGKASQRHRSAIIFRRESSQTDGLEKSGKEIIADAADFNGSDKEWNWSDGRSLKLAGMKESDDWRKHAGRERDFMGFDEAGEFLEEQVSSLLGWLRGPSDQRCQMMFGSNPPRTQDGLWLFKWFAPWLDPNFANPASSGELRYAVHTADEIIWVDGPEKITIEGSSYKPLSHTFIPAKLSDNPYRNTDDYRSRLEALPEPLRSQLLFGDFRAGTKDADYQVIPSDWVDAAQRRWTERPPENQAMTIMALDPAGGGRDSAELVCGYGGWFSRLISAQGPETADGSATAATVVKHRRDNCPVVVETDGGYGGAVKQRLEDNGVTVIAFKSGSGSTAKTNDGQLTFANKRSEAWWKLREELDPDQEGGSVIALPPDPELRADLTAPTWKLTTRGIQVEPKVIIGADGKVTGGLRKRLGRSPGKGDVIAMAVSQLARAVMKQRSNNGIRPKVILGHQDQKRR